MNLVSTRAHKFAGKAIENDDFAKDAQVRKRCCADNGHPQYAAVAMLPLSE
jgi:hypothetical protein